MAVKSTFFHQENARDGQVLIEETDWLCSPGTSFAPLGESHGEGTSPGQTSRLLERIGLRDESLTIEKITMEKVAISYSVALH